MHVHLKVISTVEHLRILIYNWLFSLEREH
jgi:hypothetical protein